MSTIGLQVNDDPTGTVEVQFVDGEPRYEIVTKRAYDRILFQSELTSDGEISLIYHGSLAWRHATTRASIVEFRRQLPQAIVFVDLNIRQPWFDVDWLPELMHGVQVLKLNSAELSELVPRLDLKESTESEQRTASIVKGSADLIDRFALEQVWVTDGARGAYAVNRTGESDFQSAVETDSLVDTIGAGDAFSASVIAGLLSSHSTGQILRDATDFAARVCSIQGATTTNPDFYPTNQTRPITIESLGEMTETNEQGSNSRGLHIALLSLHGLIRGKDPELGRDADTGGQTKYVLELATELAEQPEVARVEIITRQIIDSKIDESYAQLEEQLGERAKIVRIPFGPRRYLKKEALWPYMEVFIDQTISHFRRSGLPDLIHGHYADAGLGGAQLARLLHIPFVFTGHSLGRVKRERLSRGKKSAEKLESTYKFTARIEAEEIALETASMVVASTAQEVEDQYQKYEHYVPERMEVIPPGVDLSAFHPPGNGEDLSSVDAMLQPFLRQTDKPMILTMARPDERKNLEKLVQVFGESERLQELANLVIVMGTRDDLREITKSQRTVLLNVITLIDVYDLYGKVAYPKSHEPADVPNLYRRAAASQGVFINPALTEPFGLTLLEAAASRLPIVATNDGGPRDIIANCNNGLLIDPLSEESIEKALLRMLTEPSQWQTWAENGTRGVHKHYTWKRHAKRYLRDVKEIASQSAIPALAESRSVRRLPDFDRLVITDLDNTLTGDPAGLAKFNTLIRNNPHIGFGITTGRNLKSAMKLIEKLNLPKPDVMDTSCGTELHYGEKLTSDRSWRKQIAFQWRPDEIRELLDATPGCFPQAESEQSEFKISYKLDPTLAPKTTQIKRALREAGLRANVVVSLGIYLDVIPVRGGSDLSLRHLLFKWGFTPEQLLIAGDSGNDEGMLKGRTLGVVVANYSRELEKLRKLPRIYFAKSAHAEGIIEGINYYNFLDQIVIPNDSIE